MKIFSDNECDDATVSGTDATVNYPASNVQDSRLSRIYRGGEAVDFDITGDGAIKNISEAYTNLISDPTDLTTVNWTLVNSTVTDSGDTILSEKLWELATVAGGSASLITQENFTDLTDDSYFSVIVRYVNTDKIKIAISGLDPTAVVSRVEFSTKTITFDGSIGDNLIAPVWFDDDTVRIYYSIPTAATAGTPVDVQLAIHDVDGSTQIGDKVQYSQPILLDATTTAFPFVDGTHAKDEISETFTMPDKYVCRLSITPYFQYDIALFYKFVSWQIDATHELLLQWHGSQHKFYIQWQDGGTETYLFSQEFDDGTSFTNLNQKLDIIFSLDLTSGGINASRFIVIPQSTGSLFEDSAWAVAPDIKTSDYPTLLIGQNSAGALQSNSNYEYLRVYEGLLVGTVTDSYDVTDLLKDKKLLLDKTYQDNLTATDLLVAGSTINDGDLIILRGNNVDSFNSGTPVDETVTWSKDIITHTFTKASHQYWRLSVNSSNVVDMGRIFLGESYSTAGISPAVTHIRNSASLKSISASGQSYQDTRYQYDLVSITWPALTHTQKQALIDIFETVDIGIPFFITFDETEIELTTMYVTIDDEGLRFNLLSNPAYYSAGLNIREEP